MHKWQLKNAKLSATFAHRLQFLLVDGDKICGAVNQGGDRTGLQLATAFSDGKESLDLVSKHS